MSLSIFSFNSPAPSYNETNSQALNQLNQQVFHGNLLYIKLEIDDILTRVTRFGGLS